MMLLRALVGGYIRANAIRAAITFIAIALGVAIAFAVDLANGTAIASFAQSVNVVANHVNLQVLGEGRGFDERALLRVEHQDGVQSASPAIEGELAIGASANAFEGGELLHVIGVDVTRGAVPAAASRAAGSLNDLNRFINGGGIYVSPRIAAEYHLHAGSPLRGFAGAHPVTLYVDGIIPRDAGADSSVAFVDIATAQEVFARIGRLNRIDCIVDPARLTPVKRALERSLAPDARIIEPRVRTAELQSLLRSFELNLGALAYVALLVGMYLIYNAVAISVVQRRAEIGTLRALGTTRLQIFGVFVAEGVLFGFAGSLAGLLLGAFLARFSVAAVSQTVSTLFVGTHADNVVFTASAALKAFGFGVLLAAVSAIVPALEAAATQPARTMRSGAVFERHVPQIAQGVAVGGVIVLVLAAAAAFAPPIDGLPLFGYISALLAIAGASLLTPSALALSLRPLRSAVRHGAPSVSIALRSMTATRGRLAVAIASLMVAVAMMVAIATMVGSFRATVVAWADETLAADLYVGTPGQADASYQGYFTPAAIRRIERVPGVEAVDTYRGFNVPFRGRIVQLGATDFNLTTTPRKLRFVGRVDVPRLVRVMPEGDNAIVSDPFVNRFRLGPGDTFTFATPSGTRTFHILGEYNDYSTSAGTFMMARQTFERLYRDDTVDAVAVYAKPGIPLGFLRSRIIRAARPLAVTITTNRELRTYVVQVFDRTFAITNALYAISIIIAVLGVMSTLIALVLERRPEIALLRYLGFRTAQVRQMILAQAAIVGLLAGVTGIALGIVLAILLIYVINRQSFGWLIQLRWPWAFFAESIALVVIAALLAAIVPSNLAARIKTAEALRAE
jgi:putative ABC transport system permease protein